MSNGFICIMGIATVFVGLICIVFLCMIMSNICKKFEKPQAEVLPVQSASDNVGAEDKQQIIAGVCTAIAEDLGTDVNNIKVTSFKKL